MKRKQIYKDDGTPYLTKEGEPIFENTLELGDSFIPKINKPIVKEGKFINYSIPVDLIDKDKNKFEGIFIKLTPTQAQSISTTEDANQKLFKTYSYKNEFGEFISVTANEFKEAKTLKDFGF